MAAFSTLFACHCLACRVIWKYGQIVKLRAESYWDLLYKLFTLSVFIGNYLTLITWVNNCFLYLLNN